ncbi:MAG: glycolate oxidase subunit GlcE [Rhodobacteraceae bacterium]|nr:glycolate oxidase subunit GlcE [Paracoccaceae bacterium]
MRPETEAELADIILNADDPLRIHGGGTRSDQTMTGTALDTRALSGITLYEPGALTLVAKAGTPLTEINATLAEQGQRLAFEPMDHRVVLGTQGEPTIGGVAAANVSGPRRIQVGACRDFMIGVQYVDGSGQLVKNGGRVMKNVTGYDLVKLMAGSWGTLGVMTEVSMKVLAIPQAEATLVRHGHTPQDAVQSMTAALGSPYDVSGAAHFNGRTQIRIEGLAGSVEYRAGQLQASELAGFERVDGEVSAMLWTEVRDVTPFAQTTGALWRVSVKPSDGVGITAALQRAEVAHDVIYDWGGGLLWVLVHAKSEVRSDGAAQVLRNAVNAVGGHATLVRRGTGMSQDVPVFHPEAPGVAALGTALRARHDPRGILNPGLMG